MDNLTSAVALLNCEVALAHPAVRRAWYCVQRHLPDAGEKLTLDQYRAHREKFQCRP